MPATSEKSRNTMFQAIKYLTFSASIDENGASAVEYGLLIALIAAVMLAAVFTLGGVLNGIFTDYNTSYTSVVGG